MPYSLDPSDLEGDELDRWYRRSPQEIALQQQATQAQRYRDFFGIPDDTDDSDGAERDAAADQDISDQWGGAQPPSLQSPSSNGLGAVDGSSINPVGAEDFPHPIPLSEPPFAIGVSWPPPVPMPMPWTPGSEGRQPVPLNQIDPASSQFDPTATTGSGQTPVPSLTHPNPTKPTFIGASAPATGASSTGSAQPDPSKVDVFQPDPDGKLQPIPGWHTTGPFDFGTWSHNVNWGGVANDLANIGMGVADFTGAGELGSAILAGLRYKIGPAVVRGIVHGHHPLPRFMGGAADQQLARLHQSIHQMFHADLGAALREAGFPRVGGRGGGTEDWTAFFKENPDAENRAIETLQRVTRDFDKKNGTKISKYLDGELSRHKPPQPPPQQ
ncbi:MAG TPA: hypothetical protein VNW53_14880 [Phenylobacterium sp.]|jgi:hypothetical protein|uniref:hypothetical protein n=1 Tax=Phenylobacterium sp. TaxID=1871053 RepID=UPI002D008DE7|nr:hypothetical protein [Phenylobacterium sp.]HXA40281.1 hypothetical protein [Phenylobacterium sp.]